MQSPSSNILFYILAVFLFSVTDSLNFLSGNLTEAENLERLATCGSSQQKANEYGGIFLKDETSSHFRKYLIALSSRHLVLNPGSKTLGFIYKKEECRNNIQKFKINSNQHWPGKLNHEKTAYYIGSCEEDSPRGFVIVEHKLHLPDIYSPHCLPDKVHKNGSEVEVFTTMNATAHSLEFIRTKIHVCNDIPGEMCTEQLVTDFGGPVVHSNNDSKTYVGHAFAHNEHSIRIIPIYPYLKQVCEVTGICERTSESAILPASLSNSKLSFVESDEPVIHVNFPTADESTIGEPAFMSSNTFLESEVIDVGELEIREMEVEIEEIMDEETDEKTNEIDLNTYFEQDEASDSEPKTEMETQVESSGEKIIILFESEESQDESDYEPFVISAVPEDSTIVRAEPFSAVIIPLPEHTIESSINQEFSTPEELLIAFLIMLSLTFFVLMCVYGFVEYTGKPYYWNIDLGNNPV